MYFLMKMAISDIPYSYVSLPEGYLQYYVIMFLSFRANVPLTPWLWKTWSQQGSAVHSCRNKSMSPRELTFDLTWICLVDVLLGPNWFVPAFTEQYFWRPQQHKECWLLVTGWSFLHRFGKEIRRWSWVLGRSLIHSSLIGAESAYPNTQNGWSIICNLRSSSVVYGMIHTTLHFMQHGQHLAAHYSLSPVVNDLTYVLWYNHPQKKRVSSTFSVFGCRSLHPWRLYADRVCQVRCLEPLKADPHKVWLED